VVFGRRQSTTVLTCFALVLTGCGGSAPATKDDNPPPSDVVVEITTTPLPRTLPATMCFVGVRDYDVTLLAQSLDPPDSCSQLADRYFPQARQLPWPPTNLEDPDVVNECDLSRSDGRIVVSRADPDLEGPRFSSAYDLAERLCESLIAEGWTAPDDN
jgi:hypothetical protein